MLVLFVVVLRTAGFISGGVEEMFVNGYKSIPQMALIVLVFAAIYPKLGYSSRNIRVSIEQEGKLKEYMLNKGYILTKETDDTLLFRKKSILDRIFKMGEDTITFKRISGGFNIEGYTKEIVRIDTGITNLFE